MSGLRAVFTGLAAMPVVVDSKVVPVKSVDNLPATVASGNLPLRLLMPLGEPQEARQKPVTITPGRLTMTVEWRATDLFLWKAVAQATVEQAAALLTDYMDAYTEALLRLKLPSGILIGNTMRDGVFTYPAGGSTAYFGVHCVIAVQEIVK